mgnify:CR=1 FL=1
MALSTGPLVFDFSGSDRFIYFPVDALMTLGPANSSNAVLAVVGWHGCVASGQTESSAIQSHVMVPGRAYRLDWSVVAQDPARYTAWLWHTTAATQSLIRQMAQWSFCVQHHTPVQRLASWLLHCWAQSPQFQLQRHAMPSAMRQCLEALPSEAFHAQSQSNLQAREEFLPAVVPQRLQALACTCHQKIALR